MKFRDGDTILAAIGIKDTPTVMVRILNPAGVPMTLFFEHFNDDHERWSCNTSDELRVLKQWVRDEPWVR